MLWFTNLSLLKKIMIVSILLLIGGISWGVSNCYNTYQLMVKDVQERNQFLVESLASMITNLEKDVIDGKITQDAAQIQVKELLRHARYEDGKQYFWINDIHGQAVMHPILPDLEKQDISQTNKKVFDLFSSFAKKLESSPDGIIYDYM
jgi:methyl-accepting chemotaxis protein